MSLNKIERLKIEYFVRFNKIPQHNLGSGMKMVVSCSLLVEVSVRSGMLTMADS